MKHAFTSTIIQVLEKHFPGEGETILESCQLIQYLNIKMKSASLGAKARSSFGNIYAVYVLVEDYIAQEFHLKGGYDKYDGARFSDLFRRQRELPGHRQNHALNHR